MFQGDYCTGGHFVSGALLYPGHFALGGFCPRWLFDWGAYGPVAFVQGRYLYNESDKNVNDLDYTSPPKEKMHGLDVKFRPSKIAQARARGIKSSENGLSQA